MKLTFQPLASLLILPSALALPTPPYPINTTTITNSTTNSTTNATITPPSRYYLQTQVKGSGNPDKNGLYVSSYHTGAGENDATLGSIDVASPGYLTGTNQTFDLGTEFPWGMQIVDYDFYAEWDFVAINAGEGSSGFFFNESGLQWNQYDGEFAGWLACDWWHGVPQLFWRSFYYATDIPSSCAEVNLLPVPISA